MEWLSAGVSWPLTHYRSIRSGWGTIEHFDRLRFDGFAGDECGGDGDLGDAVSLSNGGSFGECYSSQVATQEKRTSESTIALNNVSANCW
jgi:hypothetical protein